MTTATTPANRASEDAKPRYFIITVTQTGVVLPRLYKTSSFSSRPTVEELRAIGADINPHREDRATIDEVSSDLYHAISAIWIRP
jgi:hypothetical protein